MESCAPQKYKSQSRPRHLLLVAFYIESYFIKISQLLRDSLSNGSWYCSWEQRRICSSDRPCTKQLFGSRVAMPKKEEGQPTHTIEFFLFHTAGRLTMLDENKKESNKKQENWPRNITSDEDQSVREQPFAQSCKSIFYSFSKS